MKVSVYLLALAVSLAPAAASAQAVVPEAVAPESAVSRVVVPPPTTAPTLKPIGNDLKRFFSTNTAQIVGIFAVAGLTASHWDAPAVAEARQHMSHAVASVGTWGGNFYVQAGAGLATYAIGRATGNTRVASLGSDLARAQILSQAFVQATKYAVGRERPDGSNSQSFPSGHSATAFATATVLQQHLGWKAGVPAYGLAGFVAASRMAANRHYLSDILVGAGVGIAAGRTVTLHLGRERFALGAAPTAGGAMVTLTRR